MLIDSGSTHSFIDESIGSKLVGLIPLSRSVTVKIADGGTMKCTQQILGCRWWTQGHYFKSDFKLLNLGSYDAILGMDWLEQFSPMQVDWVNKWLEVVIDGQPVRLYGVTHQTDRCSSITPDQCLGMAKVGSLLFMVQLMSISHSEKTEIPDDIQSILDPRDYPQREYVIITFLYFLGPSLLTFALIDSIQPSRMKLRHKFQRCCKVVLSNRVRVPLHLQPF